MIKSLATPIFALMLSACTSGPVYKDKLEETLNGYAAAIRWGQFEKAQEFQDPSKRTRLDLDWLKTIHVSGYEVTYRKENPDGNLHEQTVKIQYFIENSGVEKTLIDRQTWRFDEDLGKLILETDIPAFQ